MPASTLDVNRPHYYKKLLNHSNLTHYAEVARLKILSCYRHNNNLLLWGGINLEQLKKNERKWQKQRKLLKLLWTAHCSRQAPEAANQETCPALIATSVDQLTAGSDNHDQWVTARPTAKANVAIESRTVHCDVKQF